MKDREQRRNNTKKESIVRNNLTQDWINKLKINKQKAQYKESRKQSCSLENTVRLTNP